MDRRSVSDYETRELGWAANAASALSSTDGRWALVSTSVTALIAGSIAWLAAGTMPPATSHGFEAGRNPSLLPYELFMRLSSRERAAQASIASFGPIMPVKSHPSSLSMSLDNASSDELTGDNSDDSQSRRRHAHDHDGSRRHAGNRTRRCGRADGGCESRRRCARESLQSQNAARRTDVRSDVRNRRSAKACGTRRPDHLRAAERRRCRNRRSAEPGGGSAGRASALDQLLADGANTTSPSRARPTARSRRRASSCSS